MPPKVIAETWSVDELKNAEVLADLEGWGQMKRMVAKLCAAIHNVGIIDRHWQTAEKGAGPPKMLDESAFLPRKVVRMKITRTTDKKKVVESINQKTSRFISSMAGF